MYPVGPSNIHVLSDGAQGPDPVTSGVAMCTPGPIVHTRAYQLVCMGALCHPDTYIIISSEAQFTLLPLI